MLVLIASPDIVYRMGDDVSVAAVKGHIAQTLRPMGKLQIAARAAGFDPKNIDLGVNIRNYQC